MDFQFCCGSSLPQLWAIEALACSNHVETSLLLDLLKKTPQNSNNIGKNARELVSLKFLESLFIQGARANPVSSASSRTVRLDPSDDCEDILRRIMSEISLSHPEPAGLEISKWDLEPFIKHKRSNLPKYALKQLKDAILTGSHSILSSLKQTSGLLVGSHNEHQDPEKDGNCNGIISRAESDTYDGKLVPADMHDGSIVPVNKKRRTNENPAEQMYTTHENPIKKNKHDVISNEQYLDEELTSSGVHAHISDTSTVSLKSIEGKRFCVDRKTNVGNTGLLKPPKHDTNECTSSGLGENDNVFPCGKQIPHCDAELNNKFEEQQRHDQNIKEGSKNEISNLKKTNENVNRYTRNVDEVEENVRVSDHNDGNNNGKSDISRKETASHSPQHTNNHKSLETTTRRAQNVLEDTSERCREVKCRLEEETCVEVKRQTGYPGDGNNECNSSRGLDGNVHIPHCGTEVHYEKFDAAMQYSKGENTENRRKSFHGLISTNGNIDKFDQNDPRTVSTVGEAEEDVNISCDNDGYHNERTTIDTKKKTFLSSQCTYSEDSLADFREQHLCMKCHKGGIVLSCTPDSCPIVIHQSCLDSDVVFDIREPFYCPFCAYSQAISKYMEVKKSTSLARNNLTTFICLGPHNESSNQPWRSFRIDGNCSKQNDGLPKGYELNQPNGIEKVSNYHPSCGKTAIVSTDRLVKSSKRDEQDEKIMREESPPPRDHKQQPIAEVAVHNSQTDTTYFHVSETSGREKHSDVRFKRGVLGPTEADLTCERKCSQSSQSTDAEEISEYENEDSGASKGLIKIQKQETKNLFPAIPQKQGKRIFWTSEEEDVLKKGMHIFCSPHEVIPWKKILEFGEGKFHPSRTGIDLKDKWRNMCKANPKFK